MQLVPSIGQLSSGGVVAPVDVLHVDDSLRVSSVPRHGSVADEFSLVQRFERLGHRAVVAGVLPLEATALASARRWV